MSIDKHLLYGLLGAMGKAENDRLIDAFADGYEEAADICVSVLTKNIDGLLNQIKSGNYLSDQEQFLLSKLTQVKTETERALRDYWDNSGTEDGDNGLSNGWD